MYSSMLTDKTKAPGAENNVNITNLFGSVMLGGDADSSIAGTWPAYECAIGAGGDPKGATYACGGSNPPLDPDSPTQARCGASGGGACGAGTTCVNATSFEKGVIGRCAPACNFAAYPKTGCAANYQACINGAGCMDLMMDQNNHQANAKPLLWYYQGAWTRTPFARGHSPITIPAANKHPNLGVAKAVIPNFLAGPYTQSPVFPDTTDPQNPACAKGYSLSKNGAWCNADLNAGTDQTSPTFSALTPWLEVQPGVGFRIPLDGQRDQQVVSGQLDYTGVLESYIVDYIPWTDKGKPSCVADGKCNKGFVCDSASHDCVTDDDTVRVLAIEGTDFLGEAFTCIDPQTSDILHVRMYDSAQAILDWLAAHPGGGVDQNNGGTFASAQNACQIIVRRSPYDNFIDSISSKKYGVDLNVSGGQGLGRVSDIVLYDVSLAQSL
jgi:hypothetical protein